MLNLEKVHHVAIICSDYGRSLRFYTYTEVLGLRVIAEHYRAERDSYKTDLALGKNSSSNCFPSLHLLRVRPVPKRRVSVILLSESGTLRRRPRGWKVRE
jgi:catechol 2,3-dioxygenase-like lactoylglutathione lyase family enzyme